MNSIESAKWRYATKKFDASLKVDEVLIKQLTETFNLVPTSYGLQPVRLMVISNEDIKNRLVEKCYGQRQVADCSHLLVFATVFVDEAYIESYFNLIKEIRNTADDILTPFKKQMLHSFSAMDAAQNETWAKHQAYIALGMVMSACAALKIDSCPMEGFIPSEVDSLLDLEVKGLKSCLLLPVGYRAKDDMFATMEKVRKPLSEVVFSI